MIGYLTEFVKSFGSQLWRETITIMWSCFVQLISVTDSVAAEPEDGARQWTRSWAISIHLPFLLPISRRSKIHVSLILLNFAIMIILCMSNRSGPRTLFHFKWHVTALDEQQSFCSFRPSFLFITAQCSFRCHSRHCLYLLTWHYCSFWTLSRGRSPGCLLELEVTCINHKVFGYAFS
jgi:hypothetical protein